VSLKILYTQLPLGTITKSKSVADPHLVPPGPPAQQTYHIQGAFTNWIIITDPDYLGLCSAVLAELRLSPDLTTNLAISLDCSLTSNLPDTLYVTTDNWDDIKDLLRKQHGTRVEWHIVVKDKTTKLTHTAYAETSPSLKQGLNESSEAGTNSPSKNYQATSIGTPAKSTVRSGDNTRGPRNASQLNSIPAHEDFNVQWQTFVDEFPSQDSGPDKVRLWFQKALNRRSVGSVEQDFVRRITWTGLELRTLEQGTISHELYLLLCNSSLANSLARDVEACLLEKKIVRRYLWSSREVLLMMGSLLSLNILLHFIFRGER